LLDALGVQVIYSVGTYSIILELQSFQKDHLNYFKNKEKGCLIFGSNDVELTVFLVIFVIDPIFPRSSGNEKFNS